MGRTMLKYSKLSDIFWEQEIHTIVDILNKEMIISNRDKNPYELWKGRATNMKHFKVFGSKFYIKIEYGTIGRFES
jgi:hypothetical protein